MRSNAMTVSGNLEELDTFMELISKAFFSHQTWSTFFGSVSSSIGLMCLNYVFNNRLSSNEKLRQEAIAKDNICDALNAAMRCLEVSYCFMDAKVYLDAAKEEFKSLSACLKTDYRYQNLYMNVTYASVLADVYLGEFDHALSDIEKCFQDFPLIKFRKHDLLNLRGIVHLKNESYGNASDAFSASLAVQSNQEMIRQLMYKCFLKNPDALPQKLKLDQSQARLYLSNSLLFHAATIEPCAFELNVAFIEALIESGVYDQAFEKLNALEQQYSKVMLPLSDQARLYKLFLPVLSGMALTACTNEEIKNERAESSHESLSFLNLLAGDRNNAPSQEDLNNRKIVYETRLLALQDSFNNIAPIEERKENNYQSGGSKGKQKSTRNWGWSAVGLFGVTAVCLGGASVMTRSSIYKL